MIPQYKYYILSYRRDENISSRMGKYISNSRERRRSATNRKYPHNSLRKTILMRLPQFLMKNVVVSIYIYTYSLCILYTYAYNISMILLSPIRFSNVRRRRRRRQHKQLIINPQIIDDRTTSDKCYKIIILYFIINMV